MAKTPDGRRLELWREIDAPAETVWSLFTDTDYWADWGPTISAVELDTLGGDTADSEAADSTRIGQGTTGRVRVAGVWVPFSITTCTDCRWTWSVARIPATGHRVESLGPTRCRAVFELSPLAAGYAPVCRTALRRLDRLARESTG
nr:SRPBCC family protein [Salinirubrum litoreum]